MPATTPLWDGLRAEPSLVPTRTDPDPDPDPDAVVASDQGGRGLVARGSRRRRALDRSGRRRFVGTSAIWSRRGLSALW